MEHRLDHELDREIEEEPMICTCCMGYGSHEQYIERLDRWIVLTCTPCNGTGIITRERSEELRGMNG